VSTRDPYQILGVPRTATTRQIRAAYVERARRAHPDLVGHHGTDVMRALNDAWEVLKDPSRRATLDAAAPAAAEGTTQGDQRDGHDRPRGPIGVAKPFWTGAAGPPPGRPHGPVLDFGIFAGWSIGEIARRDRGYLVWLRDRAEARPYRAEIAKLLDPTAEEEPEPRRGRWR
jgi:curved DNA-binding protein CbpA